MKKAPPSRISDRLRAQRRAGFVGRQAELERLAAIARGDGPVVTFVLGIGGMGKTSLLDAFGEGLDRGGITWRRMDCEAVEPTGAGLLAALGGCFGKPMPTVRAAAAALAEAGSRVVVVMDQYERFRLLDAWLRQELVPALPASVRLFLFARHAPVDTWAGAPGWSGLVQTLRLAPLSDAEARALLERRGLSAPVSERLLRLCQGHPLALQLAARSALERAEGGGMAPQDDGGPQAERERRPIVDVLAPIFLRDVQDATDRRLLEAACLIRRATRSVLAAMVPDAADGAPFDAAFERLRGLPFVEGEADGLTVHETVRAAIAGSLESLDPGRYQELRARAWRCLRHELGAARKAHLWRYTADTLYLVDRPVLREAFFPREMPVHYVETARPADGPALLDLVAAHDPADVDSVRRWWHALPRAFHVVRDGRGDVAAFYTMVRADEVPAELRRDDPIVERWSRHLGDPEHGVAPGAPVLFMRRVLVRETGDQPSPLRSACWLDAKRSYFEHPDARRLYLADHRDAISVLAEMGFALLPSLRLSRPSGKALSTLMLDFGPDGVLGWMAGLVDAQFARPASASAPVDACALDDHARALRVDGRRVPLTRLEYRLMQYLSARPDQVVGRDDLLRDVWGQRFGGSNVVDAGVKSLRKKLGPYGGAIVTVTGHGYRFAGFTAAARHE
jgi:hypothetical protein